MAERPMVQAVFGQYSKVSAAVNAWPELSGGALRLRPHPSAPAALASMLSQGQNAAFAQGRVLSEASAEGRIAVEGRPPLRARPERREG